MFDFIRKNQLWSLWDQGLHREIGERGHFHLKSIQDLVVYSHLRGSNGLKIAEIGGGNSRILPKLAEQNQCYNIEKFEGLAVGPTSEIKIDKVENIIAFLGEYSGKIEKNSFDVAFSVSVVEHVPEGAMDDFLSEGIEILKPGGLWLHAIDIYIEDQPSEFWLMRYDLYRKWASDPRLEPIGTVNTRDLRFTCDIASNPDNIMHDWGSISPSLIGLRQKAQSVSILAGFRKKEL